MMNKLEAYHKRQEEHQKYKNTFLNKSDRLTIGPESMSSGGVYIELEGPNGVSISGITRDEAELIIHALKFLYFTEDK